MRCATCGAVYHMCCLTNTQAARFKGRVWSCDVCLDGAGGGEAAGSSAGQHGVLEAPGTGAHSDSAAASSLYFDYSGAGPSRRMSHEGVGGITRAGLDWLEAETRRISHEDEGDDMEAAAAVAAAAAARAKVDAVGCVDGPSAAPAASAAAAFKHVPAEAQEVAGPVAVARATSLATPSRSAGAPASLPMMARVQDVPKSPRPRSPARPASVAESAPSAAAAPAAAPAATAAPSPLRRSTSGSMLVRRRSFGSHQRIDPVVSAESKER